MISQPHFSTANDANQREEKDRKMDDIKIWNIFLSVLFFCLQT